MNNITETDILELFGDIPKTATLECDGLTLYLHAILSKNGINHDCYEGWVKHSSGAVILLDRWIEWNDFIIDYRLSMWLDTDNLPSGIFKASEYPNVVYEGKIIDLPVYSLAFLESIAAPLPRYYFKQLFPDSADISSEYSEGY